MEKQRKLKIVMFEKYHQINVIDDETGETISNITGVTMRADKDTHFKPVVTLTLFNPEIEIDADTEVETTVSYRHLK
jgi:hypothetical protein